MLGLAALLPVLLMMATYHCQQSTGTVGQAAAVWPCRHSCDLRPVHALWGNAFILDDWKSYGTSIAPYIVCKPDMIRATGVASSLSLDRQMGVILLGFLVERPVTQYQHVHCKERTYPFAVCLVSNN